MWFWQQRQVRSYFIGLAAWYVILIAGMWISGSQAEIPGFLLGVVAGCIYFALMAFRVKYSVTLPVSKAVWSMRMGWIIRLIFILLVLILSMTVPLFHFVAAVVGLFSLYIVVLVAACFYFFKHHIFMQN